jgi:hypothetical protein
LQDDREVGIGSGDVDDLSNIIDQTRLEIDVLDSGLGQTLNSLRLLCAWNTRCDTTTLNGQPLLQLFMPQRELEAKLTGIDISAIWARRAAAL